MQLLRLMGEFFNNPPLICDLEVNFKEVHSHGNGVEFVYKFYGEICDNKFVQIMISFYGNS